ncbi:DUF5309 domain-containing protein [Bradyrhizobium yuanmingense]|uniref:DUF5309 domain-containing protein n=1 Tax=Bradyrhizobium yuanmingense TaxID=108015 RepID=UPI0023B9ED99|nr:DUF5309 domain-containing protein [Bradyrhizobium yuanmingense]MDF0521529.1 DUF5309 domain-containing protein [Bradyrhizobium yuanmingense]
MQTYDRVGNREDLEDVVYNISPKDTPFVSLIGSVPVSATRHDWQTDTLRAPAANAQVEGDDYAFQTKPPTVRVQNFTQIASDTLIVSNSQEKADKAGRKSELGYQLAKMGAEIKKDVELSLVSNVASSAGSSTTGRVSAGFPAWITSATSTNGLRGSGGSSGGFNSGTGLVTAATNGTQRAFNKTMLDTAISTCYNAGGNPTTVMVSPYNKRVFSTFMSDSNVAQQRSAANGKKTAIVAAADMYLSDFGELAVVPNRVMLNASASRNVLVIDPDYVARGVFRAMQTEKLAKTGDAEKRAVVTEFCLVMKNEQASTVIADTFGLTAST